MGLLNGIEKLINEHGSSVILKEHIALANDQYSLLESKVIDLQSENERLRLELEKAQVQIQQLQERINRHETFQLKFGVYWDNDDNPYCPKCKTPTSRVVWTKYINRQVQGWQVHNPTLNTDSLYSISSGEPLATYWKRFKLSEDKKNWINNT